MNSVFLAFLAFLFFYKILHSAQPAALVALGGYALFAGVRFAQFYANVQRSKHVPGYRYLLTPWASLLTLFLPPIPYINAPLNPKNNDPQRSRRPYEHFKSTIWSTVSVFSPRIYLHIADAVAIKAIVADRHRFPKPLELYRILSVYGENVLITEGDEWRKHRKIVGSTFTDATNELDWHQSTLVTRKWCDHLQERAEKNKGPVEEEDIPKVCLSLALNVICATAFGVSVPAPGEEDDHTPKGGHMHSFKETLEGALETLFVTVATPAWLSWLPLAKFKEAKVYKAELDAWFREIVQERRAALAAGDSEKKDLLSALVKANDALRAAEAKQEAGVYTNEKSEVLDEDELIGNFFLLVVAGHETSAHTLAFALGLLALYPDEQEALFAEVQAIEPDPEADIPYRSYPKFAHAQAILQETLRLYPSVIGIPKMLTTNEDTVLPCSERGPGGQTQLFVPAGTHMSIDVQSLHHDPTYWPEPEVFRPSRFLDAHSRSGSPSGENKEQQHGEAGMPYIPFSAGARSCVGQKFAQVEIVAILVTLCRRFKVVLRDQDVRAGESTPQRQERLLRNVSRLTATPLNLGLAFERR